MNALDIMKDAATTVWNNKKLWFFGIFAAAGSASGSGDHEAAGASSGGTIPEWVIPILIIAAVLGIGVLVMHIISEGALIQGVRRARNGEEPGIVAGLKAGASTFWRVLGIKAFQGVAGFLSVALITAPVVLSLFGLYPIWLGVIGTVALAFVGIPWLLSIYFIYQYALRYAVLDARSVREAVAMGYRHLHGRVAHSLSLLGVSLLGQIISGAVMVPIVLVCAIVGGLVYLVGGAVAGIAVGGSLMLPFAFAVAGALGAYQSSVWTLSYMQPEPAV